MQSTVAVVKVVMDGQAISTEYMVKHRGLFRNELNLAPTVQQIGSLNLVRPIIGIDISVHAR